ncbi:hypothetical protein [Erwinia sp. CGal63]|uniref:hypothetical protein n=1 Tax=Erwinia sp. CGal63 TaxID=2919889 RepID=UPI00300B67E7
MIKTKLIAVCFCSLLLSGCTALLWNGNEVTTSYTERKLQFQDKVTAIYQYKNLAASVIQEKKKVPLHIPAEGVAFVGEKNIYILTRGTDELLALNKIAARIPLISDSKEHTLQFDLTGSSKNKALLYFREILTIAVNQPTNKMSKEESDIISQAGFTIHEGEYFKNVEVGGIIIPKAQLNYSFNETESLERQYNIEFYSKKRATDFHPGNLATNIVLTPLALASDIIFFPISYSVLQLVGFHN